MLQSGSNEEGSMNVEKGFDQNCSRCFGDRWDVRWLLLIMASLSLAAAPPTQG